MWVITSIFQAIGQAIAWVLPISESGHSAIFHVFSNRFTGACSQLTGIIHIGIAIGLIVAFYKLFVNLFKNFFSGFNDLFHKRLSVKNSSASRRFMYMTIESFAFFLIYLIPSQKYGNVYNILHRTSYNSSLLGEGIYIAVTGVLILAALGVSDKGRKPLPNVLTAAILGAVSFFTLPTAGCSYMISIFCFAVFLAMNEKNALRYSVVMSVPTLIVMGVIEMVTAVTKVNIFAAIISLVISAAVSFFTVKVLIRLINKKQLFPFAVYDTVLGLICFIIGVFQIVSR